MDASPGDAADGYISDIELDDVLSKGHLGSSPMPGSGMFSPEPVELAARGSQQSGMRSQSAPLSQLKPGDKYEVLLKKHNNSLGLNVTVGTLEAHGNCDSKVWECFQRWVVLILTMISVIIGSWPHDM